MKPTKNDYIVANDGKRNWLVQVTSVSDTAIYGHLEKDRELGAKDAQFTHSQVVANLGPNPPHGSVFGCKVEPFWKTLMHEDWGKVFTFHRPKKEDWQSLSKALSKAYRILKANGCTEFMDTGNLNLYWYGKPRGKYSGMYHYKTVQGNPADRMILAPKNLEALVYVVLHEAAHGVWCRQLDSSIHAKWVKLYHSYMKEVRHTGEQLIKLKKEFIKDSLSVEAFATNIGDDTVHELFQNCIAIVRRKTSLSVRAIDLLAESGNLDILEANWPSVIEDTVSEVAVSEYATTCPEEFFAESMAFHLSGFKLPKRVAAAVAHTLKGLS